ncbi:MAG: hypothetical protein V3V96_13015 [Acidiferrobacterales bacterium]
MIRPRAHIDVTHCFCQLKQRIITKIRPSFAGCLNALETASI